jgi:hypothetical protein
VSCAPAQLELGVLDHLHGGGTDGVQGHGGEPEGDLGAAVEHSEDDGLEHVEADVLKAGAGDEAAEQGEGHEGGATDGEALADGGGGVAGGVEGIGLVTNGGGQLGHLSDTASVVTHWAVDVDSEAGSEGAEEA